MNTSKIKTYAIQARRDFLKAVTERANIYGIFSDDHIDPIEFKGDMAIIGERAFPKKEGELREKLVGRIERDGFTMTMRACAYTWFNRFVALRYMEIHNYLEHGYRVLSHNGDSVIPEILEHAEDVDFQGLDKNLVIELKLSGTKDNELYRLLILAQCDQLHKSMPFLFDRIDTETELLLPDNLLHTDSTIRKMVTEIDESDWSEVEIIGWIYQYYISERKDEVIGKVVKSEDIPAATQLFTPNWIVKYMVQNTLGRMWLATYPNSSLRDKMEYYIEPAEQESEVQKQLDAITPGELNPEEITFLDPACGSGHILVEAYDVLKEIYLERGYRTRDIPRLIISKNLYGLDICDRAAQLACFSVLMKARADNRRILSRDAFKLNVMAIQETKDFDVVDIATQLTKEKVIRFDGEDQLFPDFEGQMTLKSVEKAKVSNEDIIELLELFQQGKTFGSLITIPELFYDEVSLLVSLIKNKQESGDIFEREAADKIVNIIHQITVLIKEYDCVVTNPPYMGRKFMNLPTKNFINENFPNNKSDLFAAFVENSLNLIKLNGYLGLMTPFVWMFLNSYKSLRKTIVNNKHLSTLVQPEYHSFFDSAYVPICSYTIQNCFLKSTGEFFNLSRFYGADEQPIKFKEAINKSSCDWRYSTVPWEFRLLPNTAIAYWTTQRVKKIFDTSIPLSDIAIPKQGLATANNDRFLRLWYETDFNRIQFGCADIEMAKASGKKWFPYNKGGAFRKWYGNQEWIINWENDGKEIRGYGAENGGRAKSVIRNPKYYFNECISWTKVTVGTFSVRYYENGFAFDVAGCSIFPKADKSLVFLLGLLNSKLSKQLLSDLAQTLNYEVGQVATFPICNEWKCVCSQLEILVHNCIEISKAEMQFKEESWHFKTDPLIIKADMDQGVKISFINYEAHCIDKLKLMQEMETKINSILINAYGLNNEITSEVTIENITLSQADLEDNLKRLVSYSIGCTMGRYSLDHPGLIYAHSSNIDFDPSKYKTFPADDDGIIPIMDQDWFTDDAPNRLIEFLKVTWAPETLDENLKFIAGRLKPKRSENPIETIRRYLSTNFYKDHLKIYKKRPIYWLFSSGKQKAFECLVYLHRYNESTLSRMRSTYVTPLQSSFRSRLEFLQDEKGAASTTSAKNKMQKAIDKLQKKQAELVAFDDELRHYADMKISLDLDDGVKVNYGKFGNLLAEKKAITGKK